MGRVFFTLFIFLTLVGGFSSCSLIEKKPNSKIPDRREFPVNKDISPCDDFFQYSCSKAISSFKLRKDRSRHIFSFSDSQERILKAKRKYLENLLKTDSKKLTQRTLQVQDYYASCVDTSSRKKEEKDVVAQTLKQVEGLKTKKQFVDYLVNRALLGQKSFFYYSNISNLDNTDIYDFFLIPRLMSTMPDRSYYKNKKLVKNFKSLAVDFFQTLGLEKPLERAQWLVEMEKYAVDNYPIPAQIRPMYSKRKYSSKKRLLAFTRLRLKPLIKKVPHQTKIRNPMEEVFIFLNDKYIPKYSLEQLKTIYLFQVLSPLMDEGYPKYFRKKFAFYHKFLGGPPKRSQLSERCAMATNERGAFSKEIDWVLFDKFFPNFPEKRFVTLVEKVRSSILKGLKKNKWLSSKSRAHAIEKIQKARLQVVRPKSEREWDFNLIAQYSKKKYIANQRLLRLKRIEKNWLQLVHPVNKDAWSYSPLTVNAYYDPEFNKFVMMGGILQYPFYDPKAPDWVNLGSVGTVVGHELGHGVDNNGAKFDATGRVRQWMTSKDIKTFKNRGKVLVAQFEKAGHDGQLTLGENIGDLTGLTFALNAAIGTFPKDLEKRQQALRDFFLQYARLWCGVMRPKEAERLLKIDEHSLIWARVNEQVKHQGDFARAYQCKPGDPLFLPKEQRLKIW